MTDFQSLATADLSLGSESARSAIWRPLPPDVDNSSSSRGVKLPGFRFPAPGPPVSGWAHQLAEIRMQTETQSTTSSGATMAASVLAQSSSTNVSPVPHESTSPVAPAIQPPPTVTSPTSRKASSAMASQLSGTPLSAAIPRRRAQKRGKTRQQSEPRAPGSRITGDQSDPFGQVDSSAGNCSHTYIFIRILTA